MIIFPNAKINIGLNIIEKRSDGYHNIESVFYPVKLQDALEVIENTDVATKKIIFTSSGIEIPGNADENLCCKAYYLINKEYPVPKIKIHLHKHIPIGAGLGGGSADAAFFIRLLNDKFELGLAWGEMHNYARQLGSDCSFFVSNKPAFVEGVGDKFEALKLDLSKHYIALIYPNIHINTAKAYSRVVPKKAERSLENDILNLPIEQWKDFIHNDFEDSLFPQYPELKTIKGQLYSLGAVYAAMSGSGSSIYGIFKNKTDFQKHFGSYFVYEGIL
jgi:4-diphosphocytidyl-2-C-methyl-D-erythritol kinase